MKPRHDKLMQWSIMLDEPHAYTAPTSHAWWTQTDKWGEFLFWARTKASALCLQKTKRGVEDLDHPHRQLALARPWLSTLCGPRWEESTGPPPFCFLFSSLITTSTHCVTSQKERKNKKKKKEKKRPRRLAPRGGRRVPLRKSGDKQPRTDEKEYQNFVFFLQRKAALLCSANADASPHFLAVGVKTERKRQWIN